MYNFCTLFDSNYLTRGIAMYDSLKKYCNNFHLYIFTFDEISLEVLQKLKLENITLIPLSDFENDQLLAVKPTRTRAEYCWTCTSFTLRYIFDKFKVDSCTYLDADIYFYDSPEVIFKISDNGSVIITPHNFSKKYEFQYIYGKHCVQFVYFRNDKNGRMVLDDWGKACLDWCYARLEDGKFGDQKYLDDWSTKFEGIYELEHLGAVAPWNIQRYKIVEKNGVLMGVEKKTALDFGLIFYHFHNVKFFSGNILFLGYYPLSGNSIQKIYKPYIIHLKRIEENLKLNFNFYPSESKLSLPLREKAYNIIRYFRGKYNYFNITKWQN